MLDMQQKIKIFIDSKNPKVKVNPHTICVTTIAEHFEFSLPTISKHLQLLYETGIIKMQKKANKIYIEPNIETIRELGGCFTNLVENLKNNRELFFDNVILK